MSLEKRLEAIRNASAEKIPAEARSIMHRSTDALRDSGILERALAVGSKAPSFALPGSDGESRGFPGLYESGPVVLTFFRGDW